MFDFAEVSESGILCWNIYLFSLLSIGDCRSRDRYIERIVLARANTKHEWNNLYYLIWCNAGNTKRIVEGG